MCGCECEQQEQKGRIIRIKEMRYLRVMLALYKILAHYFILDDDCVVEELQLKQMKHPVFCLMFHSIKSALIPPNTTIF